MQNRIEDISFKSADHVVEEIRNMNVKGGSPFGRAAAWAFKLACQKEDLPTKEALQARFLDLKRQMLELKPTMATIHNTCNLMEDLLKQDLSLDDLKTKVVVLADRIIEASYLAVEKVGVNGANLISDGDTVLMHSYSSTLMAIYTQAARDGKKFRVICTESRPLRESRKAVDILSDLNLPVTFISDASVYEFMKEADIIIMGADTLLTDGSVANKMGSAQIARLAKSCKLPVYFASELYKLNKETLYGHKVILERRTKYELVSDDDFKDPNKVEVINQFFDITPASDICGVITEYGVLHPAQMLNYYELMVDNLKEGL